MYHSAVMVNNFHIYTTKNYTFYNIPDDITNNTSDKKRRFYGIEISKLKAASNKILLEYLRVKHGEIKKVNPLRIVNSSFIMEPEGQELNDISPVNSYLLGKAKTIREKERLRQEQIRNLKIKIIKKEIGFVEVEKLLKVINSTYGTTKEDLLEKLKELSL